ncbi:MAG: TolC family protein [Bacteroidales bacterium]|nr:TolC family protein [Bacteroidales bacterium]
MTLDECIGVARRDSREVAMQELKVVEAEQVRKSVRGHFFPQVSASGIAAWNSSKGDLINLAPQSFDIPIFLTTIPVSLPGYQLEYSIGDVYHAGVTVQQPIYMGGKIASGYRMARIGESVAREQQQLAEADAVYHTCQAYFLLLKAQQLDLVASTALAAADEMLRSVGVAGEQGMAQSTDLQKVEVTRGELLLAARKAKNGVRLAQRNLCVQMGIQPAEIVAAPVDEWLFAQKVRPFDSLDISSRPEYRMLDAQVSLNREKVTTARSDMLPQVGVQGNYGYLYGLKINDNTVLDGSSFTVLASVKIPLWQSGLVRHNVAAAKAGLDHSILQRDLLCDRMMLERMQAQNEYDEAQLRHELSLSALRLAEQNMNLEQKRYNVGQSALADLLKEKAQLQKAQEEEVEAMCDVHLAALRLMQTAGLLLDALDSVE